jgi:hypothetical protein
MVRLQGIAFADPAAAQRALERLNAGADLAWMQANAGGQLPLEAIPEGLRFDRSRLLAVDSLPRPLLEAIAGAGAGSFRLYTDGPERHHVLAILERIAARARPLEAVRESIAQRVFADERERVVKDWTRQLREASEIEILVDPAQLRALAGGDPAGLTPSR